MDFLIAGLGFGALLVVLGFALRDIGPWLRRPRPDESGQDPGAERWLTSCHGISSLMMLGGGIIVAVTSIATIAGVSDRIGNILIVVTSLAVLAAISVGALVFLRDDTLPVIAATPTPATRAVRAETVATNPLQASLRSDPLAEDWEKPVAMGAADASGSLQAAETETETEIAEVALAVDVVRDADMEANVHLLESATDPVLPVEVEIDAVGIDELTETLADEVASVPDVVASGAAFETDGEAESTAEVLRSESIDPVEPPTESVDDDLITTLNLPAAASDGARVELPSGSFGGVGLAAVFALIDETFADPPAVAGDTPADESPVVDVVLNSESRAPEAESVFDLLGGNVSERTSTQGNDLAWSIVELPLLPAAEAMPSADIEAAIVDPNEANAVQPVGDDSVSLVIAEIEPTEELELDGTGDVVLAAAEIGLPVVAFVAQDEPHSLLDDDDYDAPPVVLLAEVETHDEIEPEEIPPEPVAESWPKRSVAVRRSEPQLGGTFASPVFAGIGYPISEREPEVANSTQPVSLPAEPIASALTDLPAWGEPLNAEEELDEESVDVARSSKRGLFRRR